MHPIFSNWARWLAAGCMLLLGARVWADQVTGPTPDGPAPSAQTAPRNTVTNEQSLPLLTTADEVTQLKGEEAQRGYPVKIQGVVTCVATNSHAMVIHDATRAVWARNLSTNNTEQFELGEILQVEGTTGKGSFAPILNANRITRLGMGNLPEPMQPTWDQLLNGSLDDQYVEVKGIIEHVADEDSDGWTMVTLRTAGGTLRVKTRLVGPKIYNLRPFENDLVRMRGSLFVMWDIPTHQLMPGQIRMYPTDVAVDQPAPADPFSVPAKTAAELFLFDPQASAFERVRVTGQIVYAQPPEYFMMDASNGIRFVVRQPGPPENFEAGDKVEVVGFPELSGAAPVLREAVARKTGRADLPPPKYLTEDHLMYADNDSIRVRVKAVLMSVKETETNQVLEVQSSSWRFLARLDAPAGLRQSLRLGSTLELTGVYAAQQGGNRALGEDVTPFDLLLNSPADIRVLARPPWWTLQRLLAGVGALFFILVLAMLWIAQLRGQISKRTAELEIQIRERQRVEQRSALEQERSRIAQDLHDELGSGITEIGMLVTRAKAASVAEAKRGDYLDQMGDKARVMVTALDEIVWAMNPKHDSVASLVSYFCLYANRFLGLADIRWQLDNAALSPDQVVDSRQRHQLFLAFKEALTNIVRHSGATEVHLKVQMENGELWLAVSDNGRGLDARQPTDEMDGLANMRTRLEQLGGRFDITSVARHGTTVRFGLPAYPNHDQDRHC